MPLLDVQHATPLPVPTTTEVIATSPRIPGLEAHIPAGVILQSYDGPLTMMSLTRIPVDRPPFPLLPGTTFFFTPQGHGAQVVRPDGTPSPSGVRFVLPNVDALPAGSRVALWSYTVQDDWHVYGYSTVSADGRQIVPDVGVEFHRVYCALGLGPNQSFPGPVVGGLQDNDPVDLATGLFTYEKTDLVLPDVIPIVIKRSHRSGDPSRRTFGLGMADAYSIYLIGASLTAQWAELCVAGWGHGASPATYHATHTPTAVFA